VSSRRGPSNWANTVHVVGDVHFGITDTPSRPYGDGIQKFRMTRLLADLNRLKTAGAAPIGTLQVGDLCDGNGTSEPARASGYFAQWPWKWLACVGNHDLSSQIGQGNSQAWGAYWSPFFTLSPTPITNSDYAVDLGPFRVVAADWQMPNVNTHTALLDADTSKPTIVLSHKPLPDTSAGLSPRWGLAASALIADGASSSSATAGGVPNFGAALMVNYASVMAAWATRPHVKALFCGHLHSWPDTPGQVTTKNVGGTKTIAHLNAGATNFMGTVFTDPQSSHGPWGDPLVTYFVEMTKPDGTEWTVWARNHGAGVWMDLAGGKTSIALPVS
jgi:hypothetical protein